MNATVNPFESKRPRYAVVADTLAREIAAGDHPVGALLPREAELIERFQVSRTTIREALKRLSAMGLVATLHGIGTRVEAREMHTGYVVSMRSIADVVQYEGGRSELVLQQREDMIAQEEDRVLLNTVPGQRWRRLEGYRVTPDYDDALFAVTTMYLRSPYDSIVPARTRHKTPFYKLISEKFRFDIARIEQEIQSIALEPAAAKLLGADPGSPGMRVVRRYYSLENEPFEVTVNIYPANRYTYKMHLQRELHQ